MRRGGLLILLLYLPILVFTGPSFVYADSTSVYVGQAPVAPPAPVAAHRDTFDTMTDISKLPLTDTVYVYRSGKLEKKIAVNERVEALHVIAPVLRHRIDICAWSDWVEEHRGTNIMSYGTGTMRSFGSIPAGSVRLMVHRRSGAIDELIPKTTE